MRSGSTRGIHAFGFPKAAMALMCQDLRVADAMAAAGQPCPSASIDLAPRRRQRLAEDMIGSADATDITGSIEHPRSRPLIYAKISKVAAVQSPVVVPWKNPDLILTNDPTNGVAEKSIDRDEERWFARMRSSN